MSIDEKAFRAVCEFFNFDMEYGEKPRMLRQYLGQYEAAKTDQPVEKPVLEAAREAFRYELSHFDDADMAAAITHILQAYEASHPKRESVDPWFGFLDARTRCIQCFHHEGKSDEQIAKELSLKDADHVNSIRLMITKIEGQS